MIVGHPGFGFAAKRIVLTVPLGVLLAARIVVYILTLKKIRKEKLRGASA